MSRSLFSQVALGASLFLMVDPLMADVSIAGLRGSGSYTLNGSNPVNHRVQMGFDNEGQYFPTPFMRGRISNLISPCPDANADICGQWEFSGQHGTFAWSNPSGDGLTFFGNFKRIRGSVEDAQNANPGDPGAIYFPPDGTWNVQFQR